MIARRPLLLGFATLLLLVFGLGLWSATTRIAGAIVAHGLVEVAQNHQIVQHPEGGVVAEIAVTEAQFVQAGDVLLRLDGGQLQSERTVIEGQLHAAWALRARLEAERNDQTALDFPAELTRLAASRPDVAALTEGQTRLFLARRDSFLRQSEQLDKRRQQIAAQIAGVDAQRSALSQQLTLLRQELADQLALLDKGLAQSSRVSTLRREEAQLRGDSGELAASRAQAEGRATEVALEKLRLAALRREEANSQLRDLDPRVLELVERRRVLGDRIAGLDLRAPVSGLVLGLQVTTPRAVIRAAEPVLYLVPQDRPLVIAAQVSPLQIDALRVGQPVRLVLSALTKGGTTPEVTGHIAQISADALTDPQSHARYFRAEIALDPAELARHDGQTLLPGMPVEAFIQTGTRTPLAYLVKPFTDYFQRAFRES
jgi:HlyD family secretion protein